MYHTQKEGEGEAEMERRGGREGGLEREREGE